ncbi:PqqD family protein [Parabacteroides sp. OttesenSCG-928-G07]|nr:PqqD family protein [Parabacteroides sp. OttesenSCG-928-G21]MDL2278084.1 PqqD family protein [Parabacteroides sp. OttesenSCG-928-G07]
MNAKLKSGFLIREVAGEKVLLAAGKESTNFSKMLVLNDSAALLVDALIEKECALPDDLIDILLQNYFVDYEQAKADVDELIDILKKLNILNVNE